MPDASEYNKLITEARNEKITDSINNAFTKVGKEYVEAIDRELPDDLSNKPAVVAALKNAFQTFAGKGEETVREETISAIKARLTDHERILQRLDLVNGSVYEEALSKVATDAINSIYKRRNKGLADSFKTVERWGSSGSVVEEELTAMVREGESPERATKRVMKSLASGSPELEEAVEKFGQNGGLRNWARDEGVKPNPRLQQLSRRIGNDARMIARTEMAQSYMEADRQAAKRSEVTRGLKWTLSSNHTHEDICDTLAAQDEYGLGEGVYPPDELPLLPHPHCTCSTRFVFFD